MTLSPGSRLGSYEILAAIGAGGMGEVYRARDTRLARTVAIKILPDTLAADPQFRERFDREARTISQLTHPYICTLYDVGEQAGTAFLVMENLEGETLEQRLKKGALPLSLALQVGVQVADALAAAHRAGIVHRDLKPGNVILTNGGAKLIDFGLAKTRASGPAVAGLSMLPTTPPNLTQQGTILGTFQYMAPEQLEGQEADARTDIFAFGALLYELLTGTKAFTGRTQASLIGAILKDGSPPVSVRQPLAPASLDRLVATCLAKDPDDRWQDARDLLREMKWALAGVDSPASSGNPARTRWRDRAGWMVAAAALLTAVAVGFVAFERVPPSLPITRLDVTTPPTNEPTSFALSPDGRQLVFVATVDGISRLWLRPLDQTAAQPLGGSEDATYPFWAPDGRAIGFFGQSKLKRLDLGSGSPRVLADAPGARGGTWSRDGIIVFAPTTTGPLMRISAAGGSPAAITRLEETGHGSHRYPLFLPDGRRILFLAAFALPSSKAGIYLASLDGSPPKRLFDVNSAPAYAPPGFLLFPEQQALVARTLNVTGGSVGDPTVIAEPVGQDGTFRGAFSVSTNGVLAYRSAVYERRQLVWVDRAGTRIGVVSDPDDNGLLDPAVGPDGKRVAVSRSIQNNIDVWVFDLDRRMPSRMTFDPADDNDPLWSPDGQSLAFRSNRSGPSDLYSKGTQGGGSEQRLLESPRNKMALDWSRDGRFLLYMDTSEKGRNLWALPMAGSDHKPFPITQAPFEHREGQFAPDTHWIAYESDESGRFEIYVQPFPGPGGKWQMSTGGGIEPRWRGDGKELFYVAPDGALMAVAVRVSADRQTLEPASSVRLFRLPIVFGGSIPESAGSYRQQYAVSPDGQRFLMNLSVDTGTALPITVVQNWTAALKE